MGKFTNSSYTDEVESLQDGMKQNIIDNPFYKFNAAKETIVTYYNMDIENSTVDEAAGNIETYISRPDSPIKYRKIEKFVIYGLEKLVMNLDLGEFGLESSGFGEGEAMVVAGTIIPTSSDYFMINHTNTELLFRVINTQPDTLPNGANSFKIEYKMMHLDKQCIDDNLTGSYKFLHQNVGTNLNPLIEDSDYEKLELYDNTLSALCKFYKDIYYDERVESFILNRRNQRFYDSYLTQFLIDTDLVDSDNNYLYLTQQIKLDNKFGYNYNKSFFSALMDKDKKKVRRVDSFCYGIIIDSKVNIFYTRYEDYYNMVYERIDMNPTFLHDIVLEPFKRDLLDRIDRNEKYEDNKKYMLHNIIIKYFNNEELSDQDIEDISYIDMIEGDEVLFYYIPCILYILNAYIKDILNIKKNVFLR